MTLLLITTSHKPSQRTRSFTKDLVNVLPNTFRLNRGKRTVVDLGFECHRLRARYLFIINERRGNPSIIKIYRVKKTSEYPLLEHVGLIKLFSVKLSREIQSSKVYNPEYLRINYDKCLTNNCFQLADLFIDIYRERIRVREYDIEIFFEETSRFIDFKIYNQLGKLCGPLFKITGVKLLDREV